jgi:PAS domain S-box-containing protein
LKSKDKKPEATTSKRTEPEKDLRSRAEEAICEKSALPPDQIEALSLGQMRQILHELQVHQIELNMQNEELRAAQAELEESRARYFELYDLTPVGYLTLSEQGLITLANLTAATLLGVKRSTLISAPITRYIAREDQDIYYRHRRILFESGEAQECELRLLKREGSHFWAHLRSTVAQAEDGVPVCRLVFSSIAERKQAVEALRESEEKYRTLLENAPDTIAQFDRSLRHVFINKKAMEELGQPVESFIGKTNRELGMPESVIEKWEAGLRAAFHEKKEQVVDIEIETPNGYACYTSRIVPEFTHGDAVDTVLSITRNITDRKKIEEALKLQVRERAAVDTFTYSVSNDLQAPLRRIEGFSEILLEECSDQLSERARDYLNRISTQVSSMKALTDALLQLSKVVTREIVRETVDLSALVRVNLEKLQLSDPTRRVEKIVAPNLTLEADANLTNLIVVNLLDNAWKFTSRVEEVLIEFGCTKQNGRTVYYLKDNGAGFDMNHAAKLFTPFSKLHSVEDYPGIGFGLNLVYRIIARHGGEIWAEGEVGKGATFFFTLPGIQTIIQNH